MTLSMRSWKKFYQKRSIYSKSVNLTVIPSARRAFFAMIDTVERAINGEKLNSEVGVWASQQLIRQP